MCEPHNLEYGRVEGFYAPEPDPIAPLMNLKIKGYNEQTRHQLNKGFNLVKKYRSFMEDPKQKEMREYAKPKSGNDEPKIEGETRSNTKDPVKVEEVQSTAVRGNAITSLNQHASSRSQAPSPPSCRDTPADDLAAPNIGDLTEAESISTDPNTMVVE
jgi:hypothetical protein